MLCELNPHPTRPYDTEIRVVSDMNGWIDYSFVVNTCRAEDAIAALSTAYDAWWDTDPSLTLFEELELSLVKAGIPFESGINAVDEEED